LIGAGIGELRPSFQGEQRQRQNPTLLKTPQTLGGPNNQRQPRKCQ